MKESLKATAMAFGLAMLCGSLTCGCGAAANSVVHNKANSARQNKDNQTAGDAFFTVRNNKVVATSATTAGPAPVSKRDSSLNHWQLE